MYREQLDRPEVSALALQPAIEMGGGGLQRCISHPGQVVILTECSPSQFLLYRFHQAHRIIPLDSGGKSVHGGHGRTFHPSVGWIV